MSSQLSYSENAPPENVFNILVATDIHLGCHEKDPRRGDDSFNTFEEILRIGVAKEVDFILLGGDLFHDATPSAQCLHRCLSLLRRYCMGDKPISIQFVSDQSENFQHCVKPVVNYEDPNLNIAIPVFSIHGNHDDPSGFGRMSSLDILSDTGLLNYFGKWTDLTNIKISPLLLEKGTTKLALYGLSHIKDERLSRLFLGHQVSMLRPKESTDDWFNLFVLHQNRPNNRGRKNFISEKMLPDFLDLVVWGHEHECRIDPEFNGNFFVSQPGSPVATSLCEGEAVPKQVAILKIYGKKFSMENIKLETVRPFIMHTEVLTNYVFKTDKSVNEEVLDHLSNIVEEMLEKATQQLTGHKNQPQLPLLRLRVDYKSDLHHFNTVRFGQKFMDRVANPVDMVKLKQDKEDTKKNINLLDKEAIDKVIENEEDPLGRRVETVLERYFTEEGKDRQLSVLSVKGLGEAVSNFIDRGDKDAIDIITKHQIRRTVNHLLELDFNEDGIALQIEQYRLSRSRKQDDDIDDARTVLGEKTRNGTTLQDSEMSDDSDYESKTLPNKSTSRGGRGTRGRGATATINSEKPARGRGSRGSRAATRAKGTKEPLAQRTIQNSFATKSRTSQRNAPMYISDSD